ncbi:MAG: hypothetical protein ACFFCS_09010 [Candidatus Hodarchaeota archaeon]
MVKICSGCGYATEDMTARFCPTCGGQLVEYDAKPSIQGQIICNNCGNIAADPQMKYCAKCGTAFEDKGIQPGVGRPVIQTSTPQPASPAFITQPGQNLTIIPLSPTKFMQMTVLFSVPRANVKINKKRHGGKLVLAPEGLAFKQGMSSTGYMSLYGIRFLIPYAAIKDVLLGKNEKSFIVELVDGDSREFKVYNPRVWIDKIKEQRGV